MFKSDRKNRNIKNFKKNLISLFLTILIISTLSSISYANLEENEEINFSKDIIQTSNNIEEIPKINSRVALIFDRNSKKILYEKNGLKQVPMASTTKIMTAIVVLENTKLNDVVTIDKKAATIGGSRLGLKVNDKITVNDLLYGLMLKSGNDAAVALANYVGGSVQGFAELMNKKAKEMKLNDTHFVTPHGLDNSNHYTTAYELANMADYALQNETFKKIVETKCTNIKINESIKTINNTNELLGNLEGVYGVKTGFTNGAGRCLVTSCKRGDLDIITVVLGADTKKIRTKDSINLIEYANKKYEVIDIKKIIEEKFKNWQLLNESRIYIDKGKKTKIKLKLESINYEKKAVLKEDIDKINIEVNCLQELKAPIYENEKVGSVKVKLNGEIIENLEIKVKDDIQKKNTEDYLHYFIKMIFK